MRRTPRETSTTRHPARDTTSLARQRATLFAVTPNVSAYDRFRAFGAVLDVARFPLPTSALHEVPVRAMRVFAQRHDDYLKTLDEARLKKLDPAFDVAKLFRITLDPDVASGRRILRGQAITTLELFGPRLIFQMECDPMMTGCARLQLPPGRIFESRGEPPSTIVVSDLNLSIRPTPKLEDLPKESLYDDLAAHWRATLSWFSCAWTQPVDRVLARSLVVRARITVDTKRERTELGLRYRLDPLLLGEEEVVLEDCVVRR